jgi:hypothetical protein
MPVMDIFLLPLHRQVMACLTDYEFGAGRPLVGINHCHGVKIFFQEENAQAEIDPRLTVRLGTYYLVC